LGQPRYKFPHSEERYGKAYKFIWEDSPEKFKVIFPTDQQNFNIRYKVGGEGEKHNLILIPMWEYQNPKIDAALPRPRLRLRKSGGRIATRPNARAPFCARKGESPEEVRARIQDRPPDQILGLLEFDGAEMDDRAPINE
jgi:hypothetical protein